MEAVAALSHFLNVVKSLEVFKADATLFGGTFEVLFFAPHLGWNASNLHICQALGDRAAIRFLKLQQLFVTHVVGIVDAGIETTGLERRLKHGVLAGLCRTFGLIVPHDQHVTHHHLHHEVALLITWTAAAAKPATGRANHWLLVRNLVFVAAFSLLGRVLLTFELFYFSLLLTVFNFQFSYLAVLLVNTLIFIFVLLQLSYFHTYRVQAFYLLLKPRNLGLSFL